MKHSLRTVLYQALDSVQGHPAHDLSLYYRGKVLTSLLLSEGSKNSTTGQRRLVKLEELSTRKVIPIWEAIYPERHEPHDLLAVLNGFYLDSWDVKAAQDLRSLFPHNVDEDLGSLVLEASAMALEVAIIFTTRVSDYQWDSVAYPQDTDNQDLDYPDGWDSAYCASVVFSNGVSWSDTSYNLKRLEYWTWWLEKAMPEAYGSF